MSEQSHTPRSGFVGSLTSMPFWQKAVLGVAMTVGIAGAGAQLATHSSPPPPAPTPTETTTGAPEGSRGFVSGQPQAAPQQQHQAEPEQTWVQKASPVATKSGIGFVGAFLIGWLFRVFLKTMAVITAIGVALLFALSYFNVINIDMNAARQGWSSISEFVSTQAGNLKDLLMSHLPVSSAGAAGFATGLCRK